MSSTPRWTRRARWRRTSRCRRRSAARRRCRRSSPAACTRPADAPSTAASRACCGRPMRWSACARCSTTRKAATPTPVRASKCCAWGPMARRGRARRSRSAWCASTAITTGTTTRTAAGTTFHPALRDGGDTHAGRRRTAAKTIPVEWANTAGRLRSATRLTTRIRPRRWGWGDENRGLDARPDKVKLSLDKTGYKAGDTLVATLTPPHAGKGLVMVESDRLLYVQAIDVKAGSTIRIPVTADWERHDVYVTALVFRGGTASSKITPAARSAWRTCDGPARAARGGGSVGGEAGAAERRCASPSARRSSPARGLCHGVPRSGRILNITRFPSPLTPRRTSSPSAGGRDAYDIYGRDRELRRGQRAPAFRWRHGADALPQARRPTARVQTVDLYAGPVRLDARGIARIDVAGRTSTAPCACRRWCMRMHATETATPRRWCGAGGGRGSMPRVLAPGTAR